MAPPQRRTLEVMGTVVSLAIRGRHTADGRADEAWAEAVEVLEEADRVFSTFRPDSPASQWARGERSLASCPPELAEVVALAEQAKDVSDGAFDIGYDGGPADPSGVVKGWAVQRAADVLAELPDTDFCLSAGGDLVCRTVRPGAGPWRIGIEDPRDVRRVLATVPVRNGAVATSGTAQRGCHIVDPHRARAARPAPGHRARPRPDLDRHRGHRCVRARPGGAPLAAGPAAYRRGGAGPRRPLGGRLNRP